jgi:hypothetical protein
MIPQVSPNKSISTLQWICASAGTLVPGYTFFTTYPPPIFPGISILTGVLSFAVIYLALTYKPEMGYGDKRFEDLILWVALSLTMSFIFLSVYVLLLRYCTVLEPQHYSQRFQLGFWKFNWSLTEEGLKLKQHVPFAPLEDWMMSEGAFRQGGPEIIWKAWSIATAGYALVFTYMAGFVLWTFGFSFLARRATGLGKNSGKHPIAKSNDIE